MSQDNEELIEMIDIDPEGETVIDEVTKPGHRSRRSGFVSGMNDKQKKVAAIAGVGVAGLLGALMLVGGGEDEVVIEVEPGVKAVEISPEEAGMIATRNPDGSITYMPPDSEPAGEVVRAEDLKAIVEGKKKPKGVVVEIPEEVRAKVSSSQALDAWRKSEQGTKGVMADGGKAPSAAPSLAEAMTSAEAGAGDGDGKVGSGVEEDGLPDKTTRMAPSGPDPKATDGLMKMIEGRIAKACDDCSSGLNERVDGIEKKLEALSKKVSELSKVAANPAKKNDAPAVKPKSGRSDPVSTVKPKPAVRKQAPRARFTARDIGVKKIPTMGIVRNIVDIYPDGFIVLSRSMREVPVFIGENWLGYGRVIGVDVKNRHIYTDRGRWVVR